MVPRGEIEPPTLRFSVAGVDRTRPAIMSPQTDENTMISRFFSGHCDTRRHMLPTHGRENESAVSPQGLVAVSGANTMKLTDRTVEATRCPDGHKDALIFDDTLKGFGLRVTTGGKRVFIVQY